MARSFGKLDWRSVACTAPVVVIVACIEITRANGLLFPIPFLALYVSVVLSASSGGLLVGAVSGVLAAAYVIFAGIVGYGPASLTGGPVPVLFGVALFAATGILIGRSSKRRNATSEQNLRRISELLGKSEKTAVQLRDSEARFRDFARASSDWFWEMDTDLKFRWFPNDVERLTGIPAEWAIGKPREEIGNPEDDEPRWQEHLEILRQRKPFRNFRYRSGNANDPKWFRLSGVPTFDENSQFVGYRGIGSEITKHEQLEREAQEARLQLSLAIEGLEDAMVLWDPDDRLIAANRRFREGSGVAAENQAPGVLFADFVRAAVKLENKFEDGPELDEWVAERVRQHLNPDKPIERHIHDGTVLSITEQKLPNGCIFSVARDITERKNLESRTVQSQRLEAVGQLTGGVAHDFNNLLAVIQGNAELLDQMRGEDSELTQAIIRASRKGAALTRQLLAFSRRQSLRPESVDLGAMIAEMSDMLARILGENVAVDFAAEPGLWPAMVDPGSCESAVMNLVLNARDAMPGGGVVSVRCTNMTLDAAEGTENADLSPGDYVIVAVTDTGIGMSPEARSRAFEPFFSTKGVGKGSGMGLAMVYGFTKQTGGSVTIDSKEGSGTTVRLYLPRATEAALVDTDRSPERKRHGADETILIVEDDPDVLKVAVNMLVSLGYKTVTATSAEEARTQLLAGGSIDLVLCDVELRGGMSGFELFESLETTHPKPKFLFMSGYADDARRNSASTRSDIVLLNKPFQRADLALAIAERLKQTNSL